MRGLWHGGVVAVTAVALVTAAAGCFESAVAVGPVEQAVMDKRLVGEWTTKSDGDTIYFTVRNFNGREYYVEQRETAKDVVRYSGHLAAVGGASFINLRGLSDDGALAEKYTILRVDRAGDATVNLRQLEPDFFNGKPHDTAEQLRQVIEQNLENPQMYEADPLVLTRKPAQE